MTYNLELDVLIRYKDFAAESVAKANTAENGLVYILMDNYYSEFNLDGLEAPITTAPEKIIETLERFIDKTLDNSNLIGYILLYHTALDYLKKKSDFTIIKGKLVQKDYQSYDLFKILNVK